jgi:3-oxoacyl-[acyl-carrier-protein] synthase III
MTEISLCATGHYLPNRRISVADALNPDLLTSPAEDWRESWAYSKGSMESHGYPLELVCKRMTEIDAEFLKARSGLKTITVEAKARIFEMAVAASRQAMARAELSSPDAIIVCQSTVDTDFDSNHSTALRLQCEFNSRKLAFASEANEGASFFVSLWLARTILATDADASSILVSCVDRWRDPYPRVVGATTIFGDGASAAVLRRGPRQGWRVAALTSRFVEHFSGPYRYLLGLAPEPDFVEPAAATIEAALSESGCRSSDISAVVAPQINRKLVEDVNRRCGFAVDQQLPTRFGVDGYLGSAETLVRLDQALEDWTPRIGDRLLCWGVAFSGSFGCAVLQYT